MGAAPAVFRQSLGTGRFPCPCCSASLCPVVSASTQVSDFTRPHRHFVEVVLLGGRGSPLLCLLFPDCEIRGYAVGTSSLTHKGFWINPP